MDFLTTLLLSNGPWYFILSHPKSNHHIIYYCLIKKFLGVLPNVAISPTWSTCKRAHIGQLPWAQKVQTWTVCTKKLLIKQLYGKYAQKTLVEMLPGIVPQSKSWFTSTSVRPIRILTFGVKSANGIGWFCAFVNVLTLSSCCWKFITWKENFSSNIWTSLWRSKNLQLSRSQISHMTNITNDKF